MVLCAKVMEQCNFLKKNMQKEKENFFEKFEFDIYFFSNSW